MTVTMGEGGAGLVCMSMKARHVDSERETQDAQANRNSASAIKTPKPVSTSIVSLVVIAPSADKALELAL
jgi:hypothetical protein